jgi:acetone carboxylase beta subunit
VNKEPDFAGHRLRLPMVSIDSIGAGTGTVIHVDEATKRINLGPESAGSAVGTCYLYPDITIGDIDLILGYLNEDYFLGGKVKLNKERALQTLKERLAEPLGQDVYDVSSKVLDLLHSQMCDHLSSMLLSKGLNPAEFTLLAYGGSGPLHVWGLDRGLTLGAVLMVPWAAAFSAFGCAAAEYFHRYDKAVTFFLTPDMIDDIKMYQAMGLSAAWQELEQRGYEELEKEGIPREQVHFRYGISARYIGQISTWEAPVQKGRLENVEDLDRVIESFEKVYTTIYPAAARFPQAGYQITEVYVEAIGEKIKPVVPRYPLKNKEAAHEAHKGQREAYMDGKWAKFNVWEMDLLQAGNRIDGPAIIEHPMTTLVIPPENYVEFDEHRFIWYRRK